MQKITAIIHYITINDTYPIRRIYFILKIPFFLALVFVKNFLYLI